MRRERTVCCSTRSWWRASGIRGEDSTGYVSASLRRDSTNALQVIESLVQISHHFGARYLLSTPVSRVLLSSDGTATGVLLENGESLHADVVVLNADLVHSYTSLLPPSSYSKALTKRHHSCSSISFYWSTNRKLPGLQTHNIFLAEEYRESFDAIFNRQEMPRDPSFYVNVPSRVDESAAPEGKDALVVLVPIGHLTGGDSVAEEKKVAAMVEKARKWVFETVKARTGEDLATAVIDEQVNTPFTCMFSPLSPITPPHQTLTRALGRETFNLTHGAILGLSHSFFNVLSFRPKIVHPTYQRLYFVGASTHPGTGVPVCLAGAKLTEKEVLRGVGLMEPEGWWELWVWLMVLAAVVLVFAVAVAGVRALGMA